MNERNSFGGTAGIGDPNGNSTLIRFFLEYRENGKYRRYMLIDVPEGKDGALVQKLQRCSSDLTSGGEMHEERLAPPEDFFCSLQEIIRRHEGGGAPFSLTAAAIAGTGGALMPSVPGVSGTMGMIGMLNMMSMTGVMDVPAVTGMTGMNGSAAAGRQGDPDDFISIYREYAGGKIIDRMYMHPAGIASLRPMRVELEAYLDALFEA